ncbi:hypothetical protein GW846_04495 [Candidatus Gracilibacteria bacterium]|nr:hypothetical protein [Candidatus Gracilibacteria bacterium]
MYPIQIISSEHKIPIDFLNSNQVSLTGTGSQLQSLSLIAESGWKKYSSCLRILEDNPKLKNKNGEYVIKTKSDDILKVYCDMTTDNGGYTMYPIVNGIRSFRSTDNNSCKEVGMDMLVPRTKDLFAYVIQRYGSSYFRVMPGIFKPTNGGNYTSVAMNSETAPDWKAVDGGKWWLRDTPYTEPSGDYTANCWLQVRSVSDINNITINDAGVGSCNSLYFTESYICSTNDK